jgi:hypothetical protein
MSIVATVEAHQQTFVATCDQCRTRSAPWRTKPTATGDDFLAFLGWARSDNRILCYTCADETIQP